MNRSTRYLLVGCLLLGMLPLLATRPQQQGGQAIISSPQPNEMVRGLVTVRGSATDGNFQFYKVEFGRGANPSEWHLIGSTRSTQVIDSVLVQWDTTGLPDGVYTLRLSVVKKDGNYQEYYVRQLIVANKRPTETPTPSPAPSQTRPATLEPAPTITLAILQPTAVLAQPTPTPTPVRPGRGITMPQLPLAMWRDAFCTGASTMIAIFAVLGLVFVLKRLL